ncbi:hypothetical protein [Alicyclobacillus fastidiosus]|uniref:Lipoprotein n=1 Tax=Alicyclobacillus fastidiosus TaxID=392011 RepID=A0ABV5AA03_9BACL|nr:hypothetical protein [Alicyclobacillus fastidiosus]WEH07762.1 hypothetical protein PYS47_13395 [Alicyclobacillus fastidiosus]
MKRAYSISVGILIGVVLTGAVSCVHPYHPSYSQTPRDEVLPHDNFDQQTISEIRAHLADYDVAQTPQDHEVYMVTGGLGIANPRIMEWDSSGNMDFGGIQSGDPIFHFQFLSQSPANWKTDYYQKGKMESVPWIQEHTKSGAVYYEWNTARDQTTQFYFTKGSTYVVLTVDYGLNAAKPAFPEGLLSHLVPVGNPITQQHHSSDVQTMTSDCF